MLRAAIIVGLLIAVPAAAASHAPKPVPPKPVVGKVAIRYPDAATAIVKTKAGAAYRVSIVARPSVNGTVSNLELVLQKTDAAADTANLLDPPGNWHGYQPYTFAATDFQSGAAQSLYGASRSICGADSGLKTGIVITNVAVEKVVLEHRFTAMQIDVTLDEAPVVDGHPVCN